MSAVSQQLLNLFSQRRIACLGDDMSKQSRCALCAPAADANPALVNELITLSPGLLFVAISSARVQAFLLNPMSRPLMNPCESIGSDLLMCESVEAREGVSTGISAADRAQTIAILGEANPSPKKLVKPGHIFPLEVKNGGVLIKNAVPEAAVDLARLTNNTEAAVLVDLLGPTGELLSVEAGEEFAKQRQLPFVKLSELIRYRLQTEPLVHRVAEARLPTSLAGDLRSYIYRSLIHEGEHLALVKGQIDPNLPVLTRVQPEFTFGDVFGGDTPPTRSALHRSLNAIGQNGSGLLLYLRRPTVGQLKQQIDSWDNEYHNRSCSMLREYGLGAQILRDLGVRKVELLGDSRIDFAGLESFGVEIVGHRPVPA